MLRPAVLAAAALLALPAAAVATTSLIDLSGPIPAGEFRAWRVRIDEPSPVDLGASFGGLASDQPVLPIVNGVLRNGAAYDLGVIFTYDSEPQFSGVVRAGGEDVRIGDYAISGGGWTSYFPLPPDEYVFVLITGPADGDVDGIFRVHGAAEVLATQAGPAFWARGVDLSDTAMDLFGTGANGYARAWHASGADAPLQVQGTMVGYLGYHFPTEAHWVDPAGNPQPGGVLGGAPGAWTARFPEESFVGPICPGFCIPGLGDSREDPPFAVAADVTI